MATVTERTDKRRAWPPTSVWGIVPRVLVGRRDWSPSGVSYVTIHDYDVAKFDHTNPHKYGAKCGHRSDTVIYFDLLDTSQSKRHLRIKPCRKCWRES